MPNTNLAFGEAALREPCTGRDNIEVQTEPDGRLSEREARRLVEWAERVGVDLRPRALGVSVRFDDRSLACDFEDPTEWFGRPCPDSE